MSETPVLDLQRAIGGVLAPDAAANPRVLHFGDPHAEYHAARGSAALFDLSGRTQIELTGDDRQKFLNNFCTNAVAGLQPGQGCEAFLLNVKGRILGHVFVFATPDAFWLDTVAGQAESVIAHLDRYLITEDVQFHDRTDELGQLFLCGPQASDVLGQCDAQIEALKPYEHRTAHVHGEPVAVRRLDWLDVPGFQIIAPREPLARIWQWARDGGALPAGAAVWHALRIEAGFPLYGVDMTDDNLAQEAARTEQAISFRKGCYLGQEPVARIDALGHVNRELRRLRLEHEAAPPAGTVVLSADGRQEIGRVTSSAVSFQDNRSVALAYIRSGFTTPATAAAVQAGDGHIPATVEWNA